MEKRINQDPLRHFTLSGPLHSAKGSVILLGDRCWQDGDWKVWLQHVKWNELIRKQWRILDTVGKIYYDYEPPCRVWYHYRNLQREIPIASHLDESVRYVHGLIEQEYSIVKDYRRIVIAGYSQGANLALEAGIRFRMPLGLVFSQRGILLDKRLYNDTSVAKTPYIFTMASDDDVYPEALVQQGCRHVRSTGALAFAAKSLAGVGHDGASERENSLLMKSISVAMWQSPAESIKAFGDLPEKPMWEPC